MLTEVEIGHRVIVISSDTTKMDKTIHHLLAHYDSTLFWLQELNGCMASSECQWSIKQSQISLGVCHRWV